MSIPEEVKVAEPIVNAQEETAQDINWKNFREQRAAERKRTEDAQKEAEAARKQAEALKAAMEALLNKNNPQASVQYDGQDESEESRIEKIIEAKWEKKQREQEQKAIEREYQQIPDKIRQVHSDYDEVCSQENIDYLEHHHPEIYRAFKAAPDSLQKYGDAYKVIKKLIPNYNSKQDSNRAEKNFSKPQAMSSPGVTQTGDHAPGRILDEKQKAANHARMMRVMRGGK